MSSSARVVTEGAKGESCDGGGVFGRLRDFGLAADFVLHGRLLHAPDAQLAPSGCGHVFDERGFDRGARLEFVLERGQQCFETLDGFAPSTTVPASRP